VAIVAYVCLLTTIVFSSITEPMPNGIPDDQTEFTQPPHSAIDHASSSSAASGGSAARNASSTVAAQGLCAVRP